MLDNQSLPPLLAQAFVPSLSDGLCKSSSVSQATQLDSFDVRSVLDADAVTRGYASSAQQSEGSTDYAIQEIKSVLDRFMKECKYKCPRSPRNLELRESIALEVASWGVKLPEAHAKKIVDTACRFAETAYIHLSPEHQAFVARYTAYFIYSDDLGAHHLEALGQFARRFANGERQLDPVLERLAEMVKRSHELWTTIGSNSIITGTLDALMGYHLEFTTPNMVIRPGATRFPDYMRYRTGINPPFIAFIFMRSWEFTTESYLQLIPELESWIGFVNDLFSFYKEHLAHEANNYICIRAAAEQTPPLVILRRLADEMLETTYRIYRLAEGDTALSELLHGYIQRYLEFHLDTPRYRLAELGLTA
ncbi:terpenoid synthase [Trametes cingulata]|nr:terpenoid synthase [Trametes cingulata]